MKVACLQYKSDQSEEETLRKILPLIDKTAKKNVDLITLPECSTFLNKTSSETFKNAKDEKNSLTLKIIREKAKELDINILIGSLQTLDLKKSIQKVFNRSFLINNKGKIICKYDKIHMFDVKISKTNTYQESKTYESGNSAKIGKIKVNGKYYKIGMTICYDVRFPNLYRELAKKGADFISIPAAFTYTTGLAHWHSLIRARAIENGCFVFAPAQVGNHENGRKTYGHSMIVDPWGKVISSATNRKGIIYAKVDPTLVRKSREKIPSMTSFL